MLDGLKHDYGKLYREFRAQNPGKFLGLLDPPEIDAITGLVATHGAHRLLDYGSGAGHQYLVHRQHEAWGGSLPHCYDPGIVGMDAEPAGKFDGLISTDVLEHIDYDDLPAVVHHMADFVAPSGFMFLKIQCLPARKTFEDGRNVHLTVKGPVWWTECLDLWTIRRRRDLKLVTMFEGEEYWKGRE